MKVLIVEPGKYTVQPDNAQTRGKVKQIGYLLEIVEEA